MSYNEIKSQNSAGTLIVLVVLAWMIAIGYMLASSSGSAEYVPALDGVAIEVRQELDLGPSPVGWLYEQEDGLSVAITEYITGEMSVFVSGPITKFNGECDPRDIIPLVPNQSCRFKIKRVNTYLWWYNRDVGGESHVILVIGEG